MKSLISSARAAARACSTFLAIAACSALACADDGQDDETAGSADSTSSAPPFDEAEVIEQASQYATALEQINDQPFSSQHGLASAVNVFVDAANAELYRTLDPSAPADIDFPEGALIVKEHLDADGAPDGFLLMYQGPDGYDPDASDWFWARIDGAGATQETGSVTFCIDCHSQAPAHILGVATDNRR